MARKINSKINNQEYYRLRVFLGYDENGNKVEKSFYGKNKTEAEFKRDQYLNNNRNEPSSLPLGTAVYNWLFDVIRHSGIKGGTFDRYVQDYSTGIKGTQIEWIKLKDIKGDHIQKYYNHLNSEDCTYNKIVRINKLLKRFFEYAIGKDLILKNPCKGIVLPGQAKQKYIQAKKKVDIFSDEDISKIIKEAYNKYPIYGCVIELLATLGAREGEVLALSHEDIHSDYLEINASIRKEKNYETGKFVFVRNYAKNETSIRKLYFQKETGFIFRKAKAFQNEQILLNPDYHNEFNLMFTTESGNPIEARNFLRFWKQLLESLEVDYRSPHKLRHTFISNCAEKDIPKDLVQLVVGHRFGSKITDQIYTHISDTKIKESMKKIIK